MAGLGDLPSRVPGAEVSDVVCPLSSAAERSGEERRRRRRVNEETQLLPLPQAESWSPVSIPPVVKIVTSGKMKFQNKAVVFFFTGLDG